MIHIIYITIILLLILVGVLACGELGVERRKNLFLTEHCKELTKNLVIFTERDKLHKKLNQNLTEQIQLLEQEIKHKSWQQKK